MEQPIEAVFVCTCCRKKFYLSGYKINRLGVRNKTCIECYNRQTVRRCPHNKQRILVLTVALNKLYIRE